MYTAQSLRTQHTVQVHCPEFAYTAHSSSTLPRVCAHSSSTLHRVCAHSTHFMYTAQSLRTQHTVQVHCPEFVHTVQVHCTEFAHTAHSSSTPQRVCAHSTYFMYTAHSLRTQHTVYICIRSALIAVVPRPQEGKDRGTFLCDLNCTNVHPGRTRLPPRLQSSPSWSCRGVGCSPPRGHFWRQLLKEHHSNSPRVCEGRELWLCTVRFVCTEKGCRRNWISHSPWKSWCTRTPSPPRTRS